MPQGMAKKQTPLSTQPSPLNTTPFLSYLFSQTHLEYRLAIFNFFPPILQSGFSPLLHTKLLLSRSPMTSTLLNPEVDLQTSLYLTRQQHFIQLIPKPLFTLLPGITLSWFSLYLTSFFQAPLQVLSHLPILEMLELQGSIFEQLPFVSTLAALMTSSSPMGEIWSHLEPDNSQFPICLQFKPLPGCCVHCTSSLLGISIWISSEYFKLHIPQMSS